MNAAIETTDLHKVYGNHLAVDRLSMSIVEGSVFGLVGPNGAGKTTTLRMLLDIIRPTSGAATVLGVDPRRGGGALRRRIGFLPGELRLNGRATARRTLEFYARVSGPVAPGRIDELADRLGLNLAQQVRTLSKGNKQKIGLVQAFMHDPELMVLDEPTSGLDPLVQREFLAMVSEVREQGTTVLLSSHVLSEIERAADDVAVLREGRVVASGDVATLRASAQRRVEATVAGATAKQVRLAFSRTQGVVSIDLRDLRDRVSFTATVEGSLDPTVKLLAKLQVIDLTITEPDLEDAVLRLYGSPSGTAGRELADA